MTSSPTESGTRDQRLHRLLECTSDGICEVDTRRTVHVFQCHRGSPAWLRSRGPNGQRLARCHPSKRQSPRAGRMLNLSGREKRSRIENRRGRTSDPRSIVAQEWASDSGGLFGSSLVPPGRLIDAARSIYQLHLLIANPSRRESAVTNASDAS